MLPCIAYQITSVRDSIFLPESRDYICPTCKKGRLHYRDHCRRIVRHEGGEAEWFFILRIRCDNLGYRRLLRMLPGFWYSPTLLCRGDLRCPGRCRHTGRRRLRGPAFCGYHEKMASLADGKRTLYGQIVYVAWERNVERYSL